MVKQYEVYWVNLDPTRGSEINKTRPVVVISPDSSNNHLNTVIVAPVTSRIRNFPMRLKIRLEGRVGQVALDQIRCVDKKRLLNRMAELSGKEVKLLKQLLKEYLVD